MDFFAKPMQKKRAAVGGLCKGSQIYPSLTAPRMFTKHPVVAMHIYVIYSITVSVSGRCLDPKRRHTYTHTNTQRFRECAMMCIWLASVHSRLAIAFSDRVHALDWLLGWRFIAFGCVSIRGLCIGGTFAIRECATKPVPRAMLENCTRKTTR